ncbi:MAG TPA: FHA domain-containing protein [Planctomycetota bacterium]|nr:FHA domain-containing protein [Planctomycetota bacterium]
MPKLLVTGPDNVTREFDITREMTLGRHAGNDINIPEEKASRRHCRFRPINNKVFVEDLQSSNGTKIMGRKIDREHELKNGETITIGKHIIIFHDENQPERLDRTMVLPDENGNIRVGMAAVSDPLALVKPGAEPRIGSDEEQMAPKPRPRDEANDEHAPPSQLGKILTLCALGIVFVVTVSITVSRSRKAAPEIAEAPSPAAAPAPLQPAAAVEQTGVAPVVTLTPAVPKPDVTPPPAVVTPKPATQKPVAPPPKAKPADPAVGAALTKALAEKDRAIASGNFSGARAALNSFITAHPSGDAAERAKQELQDTEKIIETSLDLILKEAERAVAAKKYRLVTQHCTRLLSFDPGGKFGNAARDILTKVDESSEGRYNEMQQKASEQLKAGQLDKASETLEKALDELGGTKWAEPVSAEQLRVLMGRSILRQLEAERAKREKAAGKPVPIAFAAKKINGQFLRVNGLALEVKSGGITLAVPVKEMQPAELHGVLQQFNLANRNLELAYLWVLLEKTANAQAEVEKALQNPEQAGAAMRLVHLLPNQQNLKIYDFSKWQHQTEWEATSGNWSTQNDRYVLDSAEGGDTTLKSSVFGGAFAAKNARISFDFELNNPGANYFFAFELGNEQKAISTIFSAQGLSIHANLNGGQDEKMTWTAGPTHVDLSVTGNSLSVSINGQPAKKIDIDGLEELKGTLSFKVRESACSIDNVIVRNAE